MFVDLTEGGQKGLIKWNTGSLRRKKSRERRIKVLGMEEKGKGLSSKMGPYVVVDGMKYHHGLLTAMPFPPMAWVPLWLFSLTGVFRVKIQISLSLPLWNHNKGTRRVLLPLAQNKMKEQRKFDSMPAN